MAHVARGKGNFGDVPLGLPARCNSTCEIGVVRDNQDARLIQSGPIPSAAYDLSFSASSMNESSRFVLIPRFTAASVFFARFACSTRP